MQAVAVSLLLAAATSSAFASSDSSTITAGPSATQVANAKRADSSSGGASALPLTQYTFSYADIPYQVNPYASGRGPQTGVNICNDTTAVADGQCQTLIANNASDFCLWGSPTTDELSTIGDIEAAVISYCTNDKLGGRVIPAGAITGLQVMRTSAYTQWTGHINQAALGLTAEDSGGELDPHGADLAGNPLGGLVYSNNLPTGDGKTLVQAVEWNNFVGGGTFCIKLCEPTVTDVNYCQNIYDLLGCSYNAPAAYEDNVFLDCEGELQDVVGTYTSDGKTVTWSQPSELPATSTLPWTPRIPASSSCTTYSSSDLFPGTLLGYQSTSAPTTTGASSGASKSGSSGAAKTGAASSGASDTSSAFRTFSGPSDLLVASLSFSAIGLLIGGIVALA